MKMRFYRIADILIRIAADDGIPVRERSPVMEKFLVDTPRTADFPMISIRITDHPKPDPEMPDVLFDADGVWKIAGDRQGYRIVSHPEAMPRPLWEARFDETFSCGRVFCGDRLKDDENGRTILYNPVTYPLDQILMMNFLAHHQGMIVHAAGWRYRDSGWIFAGKSGAGKSTISNLIGEKTGSTFLSDDRVAVRHSGGKLTLYGTPWPGDAGFAVNEGVPLSGIFFLDKHQDIAIRRLPVAEAVSRLLPVMSVPWYDRGKVVQIMDFTHLLLSEIPVYLLSFFPDGKVVDLLERFINEPWA